MENFPDIVRSKRFWSAVFGSVFMLVVALVPDLSIYRDELIEAAVIITGMLIGGFSLQDAAQAYTTGQTKYLKVDKPASDSMDSSVKVDIQTTGKDNRPAIG